MNTDPMGFRWVCALFILTKQILGQSCYTPDRQQGHCVPLNECPKAFDIFADPPKGSETYLRQFLCKEMKQLKVCCATATNFTLLKDDPIRDPTELLYDYAFNYCSQESVSDINLPVILRESGDFNVELKKCLGILANPRYIITPAQCVMPNAQGQQFIIVGVKFSGKNNNSLTFGVQEVISHPFYDPVTGTNDIALLRLNETVLDDNVPSLCYRQVVVEGWPIGKQIFTYSNLVLSTIERGLNKTTVSITWLSKEECEEDFQQKGVYVVLTKYDLCTKNVKNFTKLACNEFTGVPLFFEDDETGYIGISSSRTVCSDGLPDIYTNLNAYSGWLEGKMKPWPIKSDPCTTPNGEIGECWHALNCPALLDAFSSVTNATEAYLRGFICARDEDWFAVCCVTSSNSTIVLKKDEPKPVDVPIKFLETHLCGMQHRDDYFSSSAAIAIDEFPWIALIELPLRICTGTLINSRYVLTAALCVAMTVETTVVRLGDYNQFNETSCVKDPDIDATDCTETEKYGVEDIIQHPFYMPYTDLNDIGLLRLNKTVPYYTDFVRPICLPIPGTVTPKVGDIMYMSSWGNQRDDSKRGIKKKVLVQLISEEECERQLRVINIKPLNRICALHYQNNTEFVTFKDDGGQLMFHNNYRWHIAGLVDTIGPPDDLPVLFVNVLKYINWIIESMEPW